MCWIGFLDVCLYGAQLLLNLLCPFPWRTYPDEQPSDHNILTTTFCLWWGQLQCLSSALRINIISIITFAASALISSRKFIWLVSVNSSDLISLGTISVFHLWLHSLELLNDFVGRPERKAGTDISIVSWNQLLFIFKKSYSL